MIGSALLLAETVEGCINSTRFTCEEDNFESHHTEVIGSYASFPFYLSFFYFFIIG